MINKILTFIAATGFSICSAQNPIIQTKFTADPAPLVYHDTVFLFTGHDEDDAFGFKMKDWLLYTSTDMVNWTDHGVVASLKDFNWVKYVESFCGEPAAVPHAAIQRECEWTAG